MKYNNIIKKFSTARRKIKCHERKNNNKLSNHTMTLLNNREMLKNNKKDYNKIDKLVNAKKKSQR